MMRDQIIPLGYLRLILIHPARLWVRSGYDAHSVYVFHRPTA